MATETCITSPFDAERSAGAPTISVALVTRNRPESLERTLRSLRAQTVPPHEVVVSDDSDDASAPATADLARRYDCRYVRGPQRGLYANRNRAADACVGSHVRSMDDDHEFPPMHFEECQRAVLRDPHSIWIIGEVYPNAVRRESPLCPGQLTARGYSQPPPDPERCWALSCGSAIYPRELFLHGIRNAEFFKFGALYLEFGSRLHWLGFRIRYLPTTYIVHHLDMAARSYMNREIDLSSQFFAMFCHSWVYQPTWTNRMLSMLEAAKLMARDPSTAPRAWQNASRAFATHRKTLLEQREQARKLIAAFASSSAAGRA
jgi:glycosyltransferase involved in cell wall biosynthesis